MLTLAGVPLLCPPRVAPPGTPQFDCAWIERHIDPRRVAPWLGRTWPGHRFTAIGPAAYPPPSPVVVNRLTWLSGATRWSYGHFLCAASDLPDLRQAAYADGQSKSIPLQIVAEDADATVDPLLVAVATDLHLLPPSPLARVTLAGTETRADLDGVYLLTLVDERFYWQQRPLQHRHLPSAEEWADITWADLIDACSLSLGPLIVTSPLDIPEVYGRPDLSLRLGQRRAAAVLDAALANVGRRLIREFDGTFRAVDADTSAEQFDQNRADLEPWRQTGGPRYDAEGGGDPETLPGRVLVAFPRRHCSHDERFVPLDPEEPWVEPLGDGEYASGEYTPGAGTEDYPGARLVWDTAVAAFAFSDDAEPANRAALQGLQEQIEADVLAWLVPSADLAYAGIVAWQPEGHSAAVHWEVAADVATTRVVPRAPDDSPEEYQHAVDTACPPPADCCAVVVRKLGLRPGYDTIYQGYVQIWDDAAQSWLDGEEIDVVDANE